MRAEEIYALLDSVSLEEIYGRFPSAEEFLKNLRLNGLDNSLCLADALGERAASILEDFGMDADDCIDQVAEYILSTEADGYSEEMLESIIIVGGRAKDGTVEEAEIRLCRGEVISVVGPTGSGKSRLLADIECLAQGDTPTQRRILLNGRALDEEQRPNIAGSLIAQLSQNMNFVMDLSVEEFLKMHAHSRQCADPENAVERCFACAIALSGEPFDRTAKVTQLSGGQSRALMIADTACMSALPIVLIDEIENAGIDRMQAVRLLTQEGKIILISTHDPLLALSAGKRMVMKNGGISAVLETSEAEKRALTDIVRIDDLLLGLRRTLRGGGRIDGGSLGGLFHVEDV